MPAVAKKTRIMLRPSLLFFVAPLIFPFCSEGQSKKGFIDAGAYSVYYEVSGRGEAVFFLHAGLQNHSMWNKQVKALSKKFTVITIDFPYHGQTIGHDTSLPAKEVIRTVLDSLGISKTSIVGLSMGASIGQDFIIAYPNRVNKAVLIASGINGYEKYHPIDSLTRSWYIAFRSALEAKDTARAALIFARTWGDGNKSKSDGLFKKTSRDVYEVTLQTLYVHKMLGWPHLENNPPAMEKLPEIQLPVLIIHGQDDLPFIEAASKHLERSIKGSKRVLIKDAAHMINLEKSELVNRLLLDFLK